MQTDNEGVVWEERKKEEEKQQKKKKVNDRLETRQIGLKKKKEERKQSSERHKIRMDERK